MGGTKARMQADQQIQSLAKALEMQLSNTLTVLQKLNVLVYHRLVAAYLIFVLFCNVPLALNWWKNELTGGLYYQLLVFLTVPLFFLHYRSVPDFLKTDFAKWLALLTATLGINYWLLPDQPGVSDVELIDAKDQLEVGILIFSIGFIAYVTDRKLLTTYLAIAAIPITLSIILELFYIDLISTEEMKHIGRAAGLYLNANMAGEACILLLILLLRKINKAFYNAIFLACGLAIVLTASRSAIAAYLLLAVYLVYKQGIFKLWILAPIIVLLFSEPLTYAAEQVLLSTLRDEQKVANVISRISIFTPVESEYSIEDKSSESRQDIAQFLVGDVMKNPIKGYVISPANTYGYQAHNMILEYWYTYGILGLATWVYMGIILYRASTRRRNQNLSMPLYYLWISFFDHQVFTATFWIIALSIFILATPDHAHASSPSTVPTRRKRRRRKRTSGEKGLPQSADGLKNEIRFK